MKGLPKNWPAELKQELTTPIGNDAVQPFEVSRKIRLLMEYYIDFDQVNRWREQGKNVGTDMLLIRTMERLCADLLPGFRRRKPRGKSGPRVRTTRNDVVLVYRVLAMAERRRVSESSALRIVHKNYSVYKHRELSTLDTRYDEAKGKPEVMGMVVNIRAMEVEGLIDKQALEEAFNAPDIC